MLVNTAEVDKNILKSMKSLSLLCVEDNSTTRMIYNELFSEFFDHIILAENGEDGYQKYIANDIDLVITDYEMPILNGLAMSKKIKALNKEVPIILITAVIDTEVIIEALELNISSFLQKPIKLNKVIETITAAAKLIIANKYFKDQEYEKAKKQEEKEEYSNFQEDLAFAKELNILRNDFYYQMRNANCNTLIDFSYQPLDILSGDAYSARKIDDEQTFYLVVDGMGKGLSASLTSMLMTSFINYFIDTQLESNNFDFHKLISESLKYIKPILLDEEALSIDYIILNCTNHTMQYAKFAMPVILMQTKENEVIRVKSNNPPISKYIDSFQISSYDIANVTKFLFYSDGMAESVTRFDDKLYMDYIEEDFLHSFTKENMREKLNWKVTKAEDDITFIFINKLDLETTLIFEKNFATSLEDIDNANEWYIDVWNSLTSDTQLIYDSGVVFTELFMNAYEHGNLDINLYTKNKLIEDGTYLETLMELEKETTKKINVKVNRIEYDSSSYIITHIEDEGDGFDTQILSTIFRNTKAFNGRGVFVSRNSSLGIYYNSKGNSVLYLHKI